MVLYDPLSVDIGISSNLLDHLSARLIAIISINKFIPPY